MGVDFFAIGIDFGATYSGVAFAHSAHPDAIKVITNWKDGNDQEKVPTRIAFDEERSRVYWGHNVPATIDPFTWFKLLLIDQNILSENTRTSPPLSTAREYLRVQNQKPDELVAKYLEQLWNHTLETLTAQFGDEVVGDVFAVCDAGGGTVDLVSYAVLSTNPMNVREFVKPESAISGAVYIDDQFERGLRQTIGRRWKSASVWSRRQVIEKDWEDGIKRNFDGKERDWSVTLPTDMVSAWNSILARRNKKAELFFKNGKVIIKSRHVEEWLQDVVQPVSRVIRHQIYAVHKKQSKIKSILLIGGFGSSKYLYRQLTKEFDSIDVLQSSGSRGWSAVSRGAVIWGLSNKGSGFANNTLVRSRIPRESGEISESQLFNSSRNRHGGGCRIPLARTNWALGAAVDMHDTSEPPKYMLPTSIDPDIPDVTDSDGSSELMEVVVQKIRGPDIPDLTDSDGASERSEAVMEHMSTAPNLADESDSDGAALLAESQSSVGASSTSSAMSVGSVTAALDVINAFVVRSVFCKQDLLSIITPALQSSQDEIWKFEIRICRLIRRYGKALTTETSDPIEAEAARFLRSRRISSRIARQIVEDTSHKVQREGSASRELTIPHVRQDFTDQPVNNPAEQFDINEAHGLDILEDLSERSAASSSGDNDEHHRSGIGNERFQSLENFLPSGSLQYVDLPEKATTALLEVFAASPTYLNIQVTPAGQNLSISSKPVTSSLPTQTNASTGQGPSQGQSTNPTNSNPPSGPGGMNPHQHSSQMKPSIPTPLQLRQVYLCIKKGGIWNTAYHVRPVRTETMPIDREFFSKLKEEYFSARGWLRNWFSMYRYDHSEFFRVREAFLIPKQQKLKASKFRKYDVDSSEPVDMDYPQDQHPEYEFAPDPLAEHSRPPHGPIGPLQFFNYFYRCKDDSWYLFQRQRLFPNRVKADSLKALPKHKRELDMSDDQTVLFWGIYAKENRWAIWVFAYIFLFNVSWILFAILWMFPWGHRADLQNGFVPLGISITSTMGFLALMVASGPDAERPNR
ncbi:hypothetical protein M409DRAFT_20835 [Zasmidium cellare ATCC 36951]|uniref:Uncharacterized protein n=1 Tax=Zasmidium cellare ATCC 36951 TaxID=1080233 RepID=A0A6A6CSR6_ZASCE|nr:uncharacterized protein M409DRAFT_20835 [Zasmidium cellare ATCC 36951]KAF2168819.1 hypothetical protein M409DRAFT_20835 [Zasmidium cellare ATCC 36951]